MSTPSQPELVVNPARQGHSARRVDERNSALDAQRIAGEFRRLIKAGQFTPADKGVVEDSLRFTALTRNEKETAHNMMDQIREHESFAAGYERAAR